MSRYVSPVNPAVYPHLTLVLLGIGLFFTIWFFVYEVSWMRFSVRHVIVIDHVFQVTSTKYTRDFYKEIIMSFVASLFNGFGILFLLLWVGIYV